jgi:hypothetical protein
MGPQDHAVDAQLDAATFGVLTQPKRSPLRVALWRSPGALAHAVRMEWMASAWGALPTPRGSRSTATLGNGQNYQDHIRVALLVPGVAVVQAVATSPSLSCSRWRE